MITEEYKRDLKDAIDKVRIKHNDMDALNIVIATENISVSKIRSNKQFNKNYQQGLVEGYKNAEKDFVNYEL